MKIYLSDKLFIKYISVLFLKQGLCSEQGGGQYLRIGLNIKLYKQADNNQNLKEGIISACAIYIRKPTNRMPDCQMSKSYCYLTWYLPQCNRARTMPVTVGNQAHPI